MLLPVSPDDFCFAVSDSVSVFLILFHCFIVSELKVAAGARETRWAEQLQEVLLPVSPDYFCFTVFDGGAAESCSRSCGNKVGRASAGGAAASISS